MNRIGIAALGAAALLALAGNAEAFTHHPSTAKERAQTKALNEQQLQLAQQDNAGVNANISATAGVQADTSASMAGNSPPAMHPTDGEAARPQGSDPTSGR